MKRRKKVSGTEQMRKSWRYPGDKLNRNLLGRVVGLSAATGARGRPRPRRPGRAPRSARRLRLRRSPRYYFHINHEYGGTLGDICFHRFRSCALRANLLVLVLFSTY